MKNNLTTELKAGTLPEIWKRAERQVTGTGAEISHENKKRRNHIYILITIEDGLQISHSLF